MKTFVLKHKDLDKRWWLIDASGLIVGRLAVIIATHLRGKHKPTYTPHMDCGDNVVVINTDKMIVTGSKLNKVLYRHTGWPGGIKKDTLRNKMQTRSDDVLIDAVQCMLDKNKLRYQMMRNLKVYRDGEHAHNAQQPQILDVASMNVKNTRRAG